MGFSLGLRLTLPLLFVFHPIWSFQTGAHSTARHSTTVRWKDGISIHVTPQDPTRRSPLARRNSHDPSQIQDGTLDDERRRQLIFAMLTAATGASTFTQPAASAAEAMVQDSLSETTTTNLATSDFFGILQPPLDTSEYVSYTLPNGLRVLLCSDPTSNEAAAAMDVHVGACADPKTVAGLAHFNEHMLFLGTEKYPKEDSMESFLAANGGTSNAYTDSEDTVYYFTVNAEADLKMAEVLDRFGAFFTAPLFTAAATDRELNAIESENAKNLQSDLFRSFQISKSRANSNHPFSKFFTGNKSTLLDSTKANGINLREELIKFYNRYYSANQMTLAVVGPQSIDILKKMVQDSFSEIPNTNIGKPEEDWAGIPAYSSDTSIIPSFRHVVEVVPVSDLRQVQVTWPLIYESEKEREVSLLAKPTQYVAHLLGHEGPRSLLSYLKSQGWVNSLGCSTSEELSDFETFDIVAGLTLPGLAAVDQVIESIYSYVSMLRDRPIPDYVFQEVLQLEELQWRFLTRGSPGGYVQSLSTSMQKYPPALYVAGPRRLALDAYDMDPQLSNSPRSSFPSKQSLSETRALAENLVNIMTVDNSLVTVLSKTFEGKTDLKERWYGTNYSVRLVPESTVKQWEYPQQPRKLKLDYPKPNPFIPSEAGLRVKFEKSETKKQSFEERMQPLTPPRIIRDDGPDGRWTVYFNEDRRFGKPKGFVIFQVLTKEVFASPMNAALANLYEICVTDRLGEYAYDAGLTGLSYDVKVLPRGLRLTFGGYNDKLQKFASFVSRKLSVDVKDLLPKNDIDFDRYKDQIMRALSAFDVRQPYAHASYYAQMTLQPRRFQYSNKELRDATSKATLHDLVTYVNSLWLSGKGEALIQGNYNEAEAVELVKRIGDVLPFSPIPQTELPPRLRALPLPTSTTSTLPPRLVVSEPNPSNENSVSYIMLQNMDLSEKDHVLMEILNSVVEEPFFNELRTNKQLGYIVASGVKGIAETRTLSFIVQSSVAPAESLTGAILKFLDNVETKLIEKLSKIDLAVYVKSLIDQKTEPDKDLAVEVTRNWSEIASGRLQFDRSQREAAALLDIEKADLLDFWRKIYSSSNRRILITEMVPRQGVASSKVPALGTGYGSTHFSEDNYVLGINDIAEFRRLREDV